MSAVLVHPPGGIYGEVFLPALKELLPPKIAAFHVVVGHVNPNRVKLLKELNKLLLIIWELTEIKLLRVLTLKMI